MANVANVIGGMTYFSLFLTIGAFCVGLLLKKLVKNPILNPIMNPILIAAVLIIGTLLLTGISNEDYQAGCKPLQYLLTPATICLAIAFYTQLSKLKKQLPAIIIGVVAGTVASLGSIYLMCRLFHLDKLLTASLLPKSVTTAIGIALCEEAGGIGAVATAAIVITGILGNVLSPFLCKLFRIKNEVAQGVALGTASHVIGTARATEIGQLCGAVSGVSLTLAGLLTAVFYSFLVQTL